MQSYSECIPCFIRQAHDALQQVAGGDEKLIHRTLRRVLAAAAEFPMEHTPPAMAQTTHRIIREETGNPDPYAKIKADSTRMALKLAEEARSVMAESNDPFAMAVRFSIAGNIMDFALASTWERIDFEHFTEETGRHALEAAAVEMLRTAVNEAASILVLGDNAGETVFDRLLIEQMPGRTIHYAVKSSPVINDATLEDARAAGLDRVATLMENGSDAPGTILEDCSGSFRRVFEDADLVIAKGQANYESLNESARPIFFLTQIKCPVIGRDIGAPVGSWIIRKHPGNAERNQGPGTKD